jgi:hypothetical protein
MPKVRGRCFNNEERGWRAGAVNFNNFEGASVSMGSLRLLCEKFSERGLTDKQKGDDG